MGDWKHIVCFTASIALVLGCSTPSEPGPVISPDFVPGSATQNARQNDSAHSSTESATLFGTSHHRISSVNVEQVFSIDVWVPIGMPGPHPVVYALDGNSSFGLVSQTVIPMMFAGQLPPVIVVGIGYEVESPMEVASLRSRDLLPSLEAGYVERNIGTVFEVRNGVEPGGANEFLAFIEQELKPFIESHYAVNPQDETLLGFSYGGTFTTHVLLNSTHSFERYVIGSPVLAWDQNLLFKDEEAFAARTQDMPVTVFLSAGEYEVEIGIREPAKRMMSILRGRNYNGLDLKTHVFPEETHESALGVTVSRGLRAVFGSWPAE